MYKVPQYRRVARGVLRLGVFICALALSPLACAWAGSGFDALPPDETKATNKHWRMARDYEQQMRYELARQHYALALAACRSSDTQMQLRRELESIDLQIRTMR